MRRANIVVALMVTSCGSSSYSPSDLPPGPTASEVRQLALQTTQVLGPSFQPIFACGNSKGQTFQPTRSATGWTEATGPDAIVLAIDEQGALEVLKLEGEVLTPVTQDDGLVIPVKFDPTAGDIAVAVANTKTGVSETYAFSTFDSGPSFLTWTVNIPQAGKREGGRGVQALIAQCVELPITPVPSR